VKLLGAAAPRLPCARFCCRQLTVTSRSEHRGADSLAQRVAGSALNLVGQFGALTVLSALSTIAITRLLGPSGYGAYGSAVATSALLGAMADFGFGMMLSRDMAEEEAGHRALLRSAYEVASAWSLILALAMVVMALAAPLSSDRGLALLVLAPSMAFNGLNPARVFFVVTYQTTRLVRIDVLTTFAQVLVTIIVAALGLGPVVVAATVSVGSIVNNLIVALAAERMLGPRTTDRFSRRELLRRSAPLGLLSIMTKVYLTIDLVLLGWYVAGPRLGDYAAASKILTVIAGLSGVVMGGALPALSSKARVREELDRLAERVWHWLMVGALPLFLALALFAPLLVRVALGARYHGAVPLIRILCIAGVITVMSNLVGNVMVALRKMRALFVQNSAAIILNVAGNLILIPSYGVYAAAWMTVATEALVCAGSLFSLRHELHFGRLARVSLRPGLAALIACAVALPIDRWQWVAVPVAAAVFVVALSALRAWPTEFHPARLLPAGASLRWARR
jgi:O-antigen/teichoic acid export membrane protein